MTTTPSLTATTVVSASDIGAANPFSQLADRPIALSYDGHLVAFATKAALEASDTNGLTDIYVKDLNTNTLRRVSVAADGSGANGESSSISLSADGRYVAFVSAASNLVAGDTNQVSDVFVKDLQTGAVRLVSSNNGVIGNGQSLYPVLSADGHSIAFVSRATNLAAGTVVERQNVYLKNLDTDALSVVSSSSSGAISQTADAFGPSLSADGRYVVFNSSASDLVSNPGTTEQRIYLKDTQTGAIRFILPTNFSAAATQISADGSHVAFSTYYPYSGLDTNGGLDGYLRNVITGDTRQISPSDQPGRGHGFGSEVSISSDATRAVFTGSVADFVGNQDSSVNQVYVRDLNSGVTFNLARAVNGVASMAATGNPVLAGDGKSVVFVNHPTQAGTNPSIVRVVLPDTLPVVAGDDSLDDRGAADQTLSAGAGDDLYVVRNAGTQVTETFGQGNDRLVSLVDNFTLPLNVEQFYLGGSSPLHAVGNAQDNIFRGNSATNLLEGLSGNDTFLASGGNDTFDGGTGIDTAVYGSTLRNLATVTHGAAGRFTVQLFGETNSNTLINVERIQLQDKNIALDIDGIGGQAFRLYQAAFNRTPDLAGLGYWISRLDAGLPLTDVSKSFIESGEFKSLYGTNPSHTQIVDLLYQNVLHRAADAGGRLYWVTVLDNNPGAVPEVLRQFSESPENKAALVGVMQNGVDYIPFV